jgi:hypothetical protein
VFEAERFGRRQLVFFGVGNSNTIGFYTREESALDNRVSRTECRVYTAALNFESASPIQKRFVYAEIWLSEMRGVIDMEVFYRPEGYPLWTKAGSGRFVSRNNATGEYNVLRQVRQKVRISDDTNGLAPETSELRNLLVGSKIQFCFAWKGSCQLDRVLVVAEPQVDESRLPDNDTYTFELTGTALMDYNYIV